MNIYHITWLEFAFYKDRAVVIADTETAAVNLLKERLDVDCNDDDIQCRLLGPCADAAAVPEIVCREALLR